MTISEVNRNLASHSLWEQEAAKPVQSTSAQLSSSKRDILLEQLKTSPNSDAVLVRLYMAMMDEQRANRLQGGQIIHQNILAEQEKHKALNKEAQRLHEELEKATGNIATVEWLHSMLLAGTFIAALVTVGGTALACAILAGTVLPGGVVVSGAVIAEALLASASWIPGVAGISNGLAMGTRKYYEIEAQKKEGAQFAQKELIEKSKTNLDQHLEQNGNTLKHLTQCDEAQKDMLDNLEAAMHEMARRED